MQRKLPLRSAEKVIRAAYDWEAFASRLRADGHAVYADSIQHISSQLGKIGRRMRDEAEEGKS